jgi:hypothetical protein
MLSTPSTPIGGARLFRWCESQTHERLYYGVWFHFPRNYHAPNWWNVFQWKSKVSSAKIDPFFIVNVGNRSDGSMFFYLYDWQRRISYPQTVKDIVVGQWVHVEALYHCAADTTGQVTIWQDGVLLTDVQGAATRYVDGDCQWSVNNYSDALSPNPAVLYIDDATISVGHGPFVETPR